MNRVSTFCLVLGAMVVAGVFLAPADSLALTPRRLSIQVIRATQDAGPVDPRLGSLPRDREPFVRYRSFELALDVSANLEGNRMTQTLPNGDVLIVEVEDPSDPRFVLRVRIEHEGTAVLDARVRRRTGEPMFYVGGRPWGRAALIVGIQPVL